jgi:hypothetical protein
MRAHLPHAMAYPVAGQVLSIGRPDIRPITRWCRTARLVIVHTPAVAA